MDLRYIKLNLHSNDHRSNTLWPLSYFQSAGFGIDQSSSWVPSRIHERGKRPEDDINIKLGPSENKRADRREQGCEKSKEI